MTSAAGATAARPGGAGLTFASAAGRWVLLATVLGSAVAAIDATVVGIALPSIGTEFHTGLAALQWTVIAYTLTLAGLLLVAGALGDRFGRRCIFTLGVIWFAAARLDRACDYGGGAGPPAGAGDEARSYRDQRVKAIVALDPALGPGHRAASLAAMTVPVHIVGVVENDFLPFESHAARYARHIPGASLTRLTGGEGHFIFLDVCNAERDANGVPLCRDRRGVDRSLVHARLAELRTGFFEQHLTPA